MIANSSTATKPRQPLSNHSDIQFAKLVNRMASTGERPSEDELEAIQAYRGEVSELLEALDQDGIAGFNITLQSLLKSNRRMAATLATLTPAEQEEDQEADPRLTTGKKGKTVFRTLSMSEIKQLPRTEWIIPKVLQKVGTSLTYGDANTGKTFVDVDIALHLAYGKEYQGRKLPQLRVLYIYGEGNEGLANRVEAWQKHHDKPDTDYIQFICFPVQLLSELEYLCATIEDQEEIPGLIVLDTFSVCAEGINENDNAEVARFIGAASHIKRTYKTHVHIIHHANKNGDYRGAASFRGNVDTMILLSREHENAPIVMSCKKQKDAEYFSDIKLQLQQVTLGMDPDTLEPITSCIVVGSNGLTPADRAAEAIDQEREKMLDILREHKRISVNDWIKECKALGISKNAYYEHARYFKDNRLVTYTEPLKNGLKGHYELAPSVEQSSLDTLESESA